MVESSNPVVVPVKRVLPPNKKEYDDKIALLDEDIKAIQKKVDVISKQIGEKSVGKEEFFRIRDGVKEKLDEAQAKITALETKRNEFQKKIQDKLSEGRNARSELNNMQKKLGFQSEEEVDKRIESLEYQMHTETLTLRKEKEIIAEIGKLKQTKPQLSKLKQQTSALNTSGDSVGPLKTEVEKINKELSAARDEKREHQTKFSKIMEERKKAIAGMPELFEEKQNLSKQIKEKYNEVRALRDEKNQKIREFNEYVKAQREARAERDKDIRDANEAETTRRKIEEDLDREAELPFVEEIDLIENTLKYCRGLQPKSADATEDNKQVFAEVAGATVLPRKEDREVEYFFAPSKGKKAKAKKSADAPTTSGKPLKHGLATLQLFEKLKVDIPVHTRDLEKTVEDLEVKLVEFKAKQIEVIEVRRANRAAKEAELEKATAAARLAQEKAEMAIKKATAAEKSH